MKYETRTLAMPVEIRADDDGSIKVEGYAAVFDQETNIGDVFREVIRPGAFRNAIARGDDVTFLINHGGLPLARTRSGTLKLTEDEKGLFIQTELDATDPDVRQIVPKMKRGDLDKMSFAFSVPVGGQRWSNDGQELDLREVTDTMLFDVSIVTEPAFDGTSIALRSRDDAEAEKAKAETEKKADQYFSRKAETEQKIRKI